MVDIISLAHGVAERIGEADVELAPEYSLKDVKVRTRIVVVPVGIKHKMLARNPVGTATVNFMRNFRALSKGVEFHPCASAQGKR